MFNKALDSIKVENKPVIMVKVIELRSCIVHESLASGTDKVDQVRPSHFCMVLGCCTPVLKFIRLIQMSFKISTCIGIKLSIPL